jgi:hypothetical protein
VRCRKGSILSNSQEPYQRGYPSTGQIPAPGQLPAPGQGHAAGHIPTPGQLPADGPFGLPGQQPPVRGHRRLWTVLGIVAGVLLLVIIGLLILLNIVNAATNQARGLADGFTKLVLSGDTSKAYDDYLDPALKEQLSKEAFIAGVKTLEMDGSCKPAYNNVKAGTENNVKSADITGLITCDGDRKIDLVYRFEGEELKMVNIKLKPQV